jgi:hypothetical protein
MAEVNMGKLAIGILEVERDGASGLAGSARDLSLTKFEAFREIDAHAMLSTYYRIPYRLAR